ncbi:MAG: PQQ-binding-like beta-propeller repeat protein [Planctomycetota bacterium]|nr:PQQ-binding-like beta-propeller repeat protein [Planctomycetota bacterium]
MIRILFLLPLLAAGSLEAQDWNEFRGLNGTGHSGFINMPTRWSDESDNIRWKADLEGLGWSSPVCSKGRIWLTTADETSGQLRVLILDLDSGKLLKTVVVFEKKLGRIHKKNSHASPSALIDDEAVFVHYGDYGTACLDLQGNVVWKKVFSYGHFHGPGGSPVVCGDRLILSCDGGTEQFLVALDKRTGETIWKTEKKHIHPDRFSGGKMKAIAFSTPTLRKNRGSDEVVVCGADHIAGFDVASGRENWWAAYDGYSIVPRPVFHGNMVFYASCYNSPVLYGLKIEGEGEITAKIAWQTRKGAPHNPTPLVVGKELYVVSDRGIGQCLDAETGKMHWQQRLGRGYSASPIFVDRKIYFCDETGGTIVIRPGTEYQEIARNQVSGRTLATPVPVEGGLLIRTDRSLLFVAGKK